MENNLPGIPTGVQATQSLQGIMNFFWYILIGIIVLIIALYILYKLYQKMTYNYSVDVYKKVGDTELQFEDKAKQIKHDGNYMFHYMGMNKLSPVVDSKYHRIKQKKFLGIWPSSKLHFSVYLYGESLFPIGVKNNPGLEPINIDLFNYMQSRIQANQHKYTKTNMLLQMLPYVAIGGVILMFIVGMIFYTKHVENVASMIINGASKTADDILTKGGVAQIVQPG